MKDFKYSVGTMIEIPRAALTAELSIQGGSVCGVGSRGCWPGDRVCRKVGRSTRPDLEIGICGEHGGELNSVEFFYMIGMDYVSCSPYRVPISRLAAAQVALSSKGDKSETMRTA